MYTLILHHIKTFFTINSFNVLFFKCYLVDTVDWRAGRPCVQPLKCTTGWPLPPQLHHAAGRTLQSGVHAPVHQTARGLLPFQGSGGRRVSAELGPSLAVPAWCGHLLHAVLRHGARGQTLGDVLVVGGRATLVWAVRVVRGKTSIKQSIIQCWNPNVFKGFLKSIDLAKEQK